MNIELILLSITAFGSVVYLVSSLFKAIYFVWEANTKLETARLEAQMRHG